jgi:predicted RNase H-like nuclease (RuvC/YqgF family)
LTRDSFFDALRKQQQEEKEKEKASLTSQQMRQALSQNVRMTKMFCEKYDSLEKQLLEWKERGRRYRAERDEAKTENVKLKKSNDDKDRKIAALERQLAASSTS